MKTATHILLIIISFAAITACDSDPELTPFNFFEGNWIEMENDTILQFAGTNHRFEFKNDNTFELELIRWTDVISIDTICPENRSDYITGTYNIKSNVNQFLINGSFASEDFSTLEPNCLGETNFRASFTYELINSSEVLLTPTDARLLPVRLLKVIK